ncbi:histidine phosphatase family protein [Pseudomonas sp.]|uniref:histidine phosphatase family protein n=1 Tax=Pseudomonas sp. TaxID=306 RepID=UPI002623F182|nr:histidine phosphatase family protein [Pseudomonas sp.]
MQLFVVRHGQTQANAEGRYLGSLDADLNQNGVSQAQAMRAKLPAHIDCMIVSPLRRAQQTAHIILANSSLPIRTVDAFRERNVGVFEGLTQDEAREGYPALWAQNITRQWTLAPTDGESVGEVFERVRRGLNQLLLVHPDQVVVLVAHGFVAKTIRALVRQDLSDFYDWQLGNGGVLELELAKSLPILWDDA